MRFRVHGETGVGSCIGVPDQALGIFRVDAQRVRIVAAFLRRFGAAVDFKLFRLDVVASHLAAGAHRRPQAAVVGCFNGMGCVCSAWKLDGCLFAGFRIQGDHTPPTDVDRVDQSVSTDFQVME